MYRVLGCAAVLFAIILLVAGDATGQKKPADKKDTTRTETATPQDYAYVSQMKEVVGRLISFDAGTKMLTLRLEYQHLEPNTKAVKGGKQTDQLRQQQQLMREYQEIMRIQNPMQRNQRLQQFFARAQLQQMRDLQRKTGGQNDLFKVVTLGKDFDMDVLDELTVARVTLPAEYDDKGNLIQYAAEELKKKKDASMPGYKATQDDLRAGMMVKVYLSKKKKEADGKKEAPKIEEGKTVLVQEKDLPQVRMILIQSDPDPSFLPKDPKKKKKN